MESPVIVLLGAGSSVPFDVPDSRNLTTEVSRRLPIYRQRVREIRRQVTEFGLISDIEAVLSVLEFSARPKKGIREAGPFLSEVSSRPMKDFHSNQRDARIATRIKEYIIRRCFLNDPETMQIIVKVFGSFLRQIQVVYNLPLADPPGTTPTPSIDIFTTNYDNVVEEFCRKNGVPLYDGFREMYRGNYAFSETGYGESDRTVRLYKLHGTVTYAKLRTGETDKVTFIPPRGPLKIGGHPASPDLIYPGTHLYPAKEPQLELLHLFKKHLLSAKRCIVLGYSFRDLHIHQVLADSCQRNPSLIVYAVSPKAKRRITKAGLAGVKHLVPVEKSFEQLNVAVDCP